MTSDIKDDVDRKTLIEKKADGTIVATDMREYAKAVRDSPVAVKDAVLNSVE